MDIKHELNGAPTIFDDEKILNVVLSLFQQEISVGDDGLLVSGKSIKPYDMYSAIEDDIFDARSQSQELERKDFLELIEIMSWAFYKVWCGLIETAIKDCRKVINISTIDRGEILSLFWENLSCKEGASLRQRMGRE